MAGYAGFARFFDIVNGFLIDAVEHCIGFLADTLATQQMMNLAEIIVHT